MSLNINIKGKFLRANQRFSLIPQVEIKETVGVFYLLIE